MPIIATLQCANHGSHFRAYGLRGAVALIAPSWGRTCLEEHADLSAAYPCQHLGGVLHVPRFGNGHQQPGLVRHPHLLIWQRYVELNPVRACMVAHPAEYR